MNGRFDPLPAGCERATRSLESHRSLKLASAQTTRRSYRLKLKSIVALLGLTVSIGAFADPFTPNTPAPSLIGPPAGSEQSLQTIADSVFGAGHINVDTGQSSAGLFSSTTPNFATSVPTLVAEFTANAGTQSFGIWFGTDTNNLVSYDILLGGAVAHNFVSIGINN